MLRSDTLRLRAICALSYGPVGFPTPPSSVGQLTDLLLTNLEWEGDDRSACGARENGDFDLGPPELDQGTEPTGTTHITGCSVTVAIAS